MATTDIKSGAQASFHVPLYDPDGGAVTDPGAYGRYPLSDLQEGIFAHPYTIGLHLQGTPTGTGVLWAHVFAEAVDFSETVTTFRAISAVAAAANAQLSLIKIEGTTNDIYELAVMEWGEGGMVAEFLFTDATPFTFVSGDVLMISDQNFSDDTLAGISITLTGRRI
jgi:hypothetical protein